MALPVRLSQIQVADPIKVSGFPPRTGDERDLGSCFGEFLRRTVPTNQAYGAARAFAEDVAALIRNELYPKTAPDPSRVDHLVVGGVGKRTAIAPLTSVDVLYVLPAKLIPAKAADALKTVWAVVRQHSPTAVIAADQSGVLVQTTGLVVRVIPAAPFEGAFLVPSLPTPARTSGWRINNPIAEAATLRLADSLYNGRPRLMLAALKSWKRHNEVPISSFALELLAQEFYASAPRPFALPKALIDFWAWARKRTPATLRPAGTHTPVDVEKDWHPKCKAAYWRVTLADYHADQDKVVDAALEWRAVLGDFFPVPGENDAALPLFAGGAKQPA